MAPFTHFEQSATLLVIGGGIFFAICINKKADRIAKPPFLTKLK